MHAQVAPPQPGPVCGAEPPSKRVLMWKTWYPQIPQREGKTGGPAVRRFYTFHCRLRPAPYRGCAPLAIWQ